MKITKEVVEYVAHLARLELPPSEVELYTGQLDRILAYMDQLNSIDTTGIEPTTHAMALVDVFRVDEVDHNLEAADALANAPEREASFFKVPPIIETE